MISCFVTSQVASISGSGQQHGTVYWKNGALQSLQHLSAGASLADQLGNAFSIPNGPICTAKQYSVPPAFCSSEDPGGCHGPLPTSGTSFGHSPPVFLSQGVGIRLRQNITHSNLGYTTAIKYCGVVFDGKVGSYCKPPPPHLC